jgi:Uma2 family endonuclease
MVRTGNRRTVTPVEAALAEKRVTLYNVSWNTYEKLLDELGEHRAARLTYDRGMLEIMVPLEEHESAKDLIGLFVRVLAVESGFNIKGMGSTTLKRPDLERSPEPDTCYYIQNEPLVRGRTVNLNLDPPPDLVVEVEITHSDMDKLVLYAQMGIPEFWRYNGNVLQIYQLRRENYAEVEASPTFPWVKKSSLYQFLEKCKTEGEAQTEKAFRAWVKQQVQQQQQGATEQEQKSSTNEPGIFF